MILLEPDPVMAPVIEGLMLFNSPGIMPSEVESDLTALWQGPEREPGPPVADFSVDEPLVPNPQTVVFTGSFEAYGRVASPAWYSTNRGKTWTYAEPGTVVSVTPEDFWRRAAWDPEFGEIRCPRTIEMVIARTDMWIN